MTDNTMRQDHDRRVCQRISLNLRLRLELSSGEFIEGQTEDISLGGVFLKSNRPLDPVLLGQGATLYVSNTDNRNSRPFPCRITRITENNMGLELDRDVMAAFGKELTKGMFVRKQAL